MIKKIDASTMELEEKLVALNRVSKTVKGGRIQRFTAIMVVGDKNGHVGYGLGKAAEVPDAIRKGIEDAKKNLIEVSLKGTTIPHEIIGVFGSGKVLLKPARKVPELLQAEQSVMFWRWPESKTSVQSVFVQTIRQML